LRRWPEPELVLIVIIGVNFVALIARLFILKKLIQLDLGSYIGKVIGRSTITASAIIFVAYGVSQPEVESLVQLLFNSVIVVLVAILGVLTIGLSSMERTIVFQTLIQLGRKLKRE